MKTAIETQTILDACSGVNGATRSELMHQIGCQSRTISMRLSRLVSKGLLTAVFLFPTDTKRYFTDPVFAKNAAEALRQELSFTGRSAVLPRAAAVVTPDTVNVQIVTRTGSVEKVDRMDGLAPRDNLVALRPGALDFKSIPSLSPFTMGAVR